MGCVFSYPVNRKLFPILRMKHAAICAIAEHIKQGKRRPDEARRELENCCTSLISNMFRHFATDGATTTRQEGYMLMTDVIDTAIRIGVAQKQVPVDSSSHPYVSRQIMGGGPSNHVNKSELFRILSVKRTEIWTIAGHIKEGTKRPDEVRRELENCCTSLMSNMFGEFGIDVDTTTEEWLMTDLIETAIQIGVAQKQGEIDKKILNIQGQSTPQMTLMDIAIPDETVRPKLHIRDRPKSYNAMADVMVINPYDDGTKETVRDLIKTMESGLRSKAGKFDLDLDIQVRDRYDSNEVKNKSVLVLPCMNTSRIAEDLQDMVKHAMKRGVEEDANCIVAVLTPKEKHAKDPQDTRVSLKSSHAPEKWTFADFRFNSEYGVYDHAFNTDGYKKIVEACLGVKHPV